MKQIFVLQIALIAAAGAAAADDATAGKAFYDKSCKSCHGPNGEPNVAIAKMMKVEMRRLGSKEVQALSDAELKKIVTAGTGKMKPVKSITGAAVDDVVAYLRSLKQ